MTPFLSSMAKTALLICTAVREKKKKKKELGVRENADI